MNKKYNEKYCIYIYIFAGDSSGNLTAMEHPPFVGMFPTAYGDFPLQCCLTIG